MPMMVRLADGRLVEGVMDLAWTDGTRWTLLDYKTDDASHEPYKRQLRTYALALQQATGLPVRAILLEV
jgi:ATP-dependent exoDNAse (exonuclease V) beta subunit